MVNALRLRAKQTALANPPVWPVRITRKSSLDSLRKTATRREVGVPVNIPRGKTVFCDGEQAQYFYKVTAGAIRLVKIMLDGRRQVIEFALPGDVFGLDCHNIHNVHAEAITAAKLMRYPRKSVELLGEQIPQIGRDLALVLRRGWILAQAHMVMLGRQSAKERVASFLVEMAEHQSTENGGSVYFPMGRQDIADHLGLTIETVCRTLSDLKSSYILSLPDRHHIIIWNRGALDSLVHGDAQTNTKDSRTLGPRPRAPKVDFDDPSNKQMP